MTDYVQVPLPLAKKAVIAFGDGGYTDEMMKMEGLLPIEDQPPLIGVVVMAGRDGEREPYIRTGKSGAYYAWLRIDEDCGYNWDDLVNPVRITPEERKRWGIV